MKKHPVWLTYARKVGMTYGMLLFVVLYTGVGVSAQDPKGSSGDMVAHQAKVAWMNGSPNRALEILDQGTREFPQFSPLQKLRGDILTTIR
ncbi:MAG: hypothetical protein OEW26_06270, partial [Nitrospirota bacterium]|nr:hypothetical protein [Nitrospirota bacterium]